MTTIGRGRWWSGPEEEMSPLLDEAFSVNPVHTDIWILAASGLRLETEDVRTTKPNFRTKWEPGKL